MIAGKARDTDARRQLYGRRHGRPLRPARARLMQTLLPRLAITFPEQGRLLDPKSLFDFNPREIWLEIGFGAGEHLAAQAAANGDVGFLGAEVFVNGVASLLSQVESQELANIRILQGDGRSLLDALPEASIGRVFILFPDPWPKLRHRGRRIVQPELLESLARVLKDRAELRLATDDPDYLTWMLQLATRHPDFHWQARRADDWRRRPDGWPATRYEEKACRKGVESTYLRFSRRPRGLERQDIGSGNGV